MTLSDTSSQVGVPSFPSDAVSPQRMFVACSRRDLQRKYYLEIILDSMALMVDATAVMLEEKRLNGRLVILENPLVCDIAGFSAFTPDFLYVEVRFRWVLLHWISGSESNKVYKLRLAASS